MLPVSQHGLFGANPGHVKTMELLLCLCPLPETLMRLCFCTPDTMQLCSHPNRDNWRLGTTICLTGFLLQCLEDLDASLRKLNSRLFVIRGQPANVFPRLFKAKFKEWKISRLTFEYDSEPFGKERDAAIKKLASEAGVEVIVKISHTLYNLDR
ncbi:CRY1 protein, partial [Polypterus senegalus]